MPDIIERQVPISAVLVKRPSPNQWAKVSWSLLGTVPGLSDSQINEVTEQGGELHIIADLSLELHVKHCDSYYINLTSQQPKVYFGCQQQEDDLKPILMTVDFDEAAALMETGETVLDAPLPESLCLWLERFVLEHYQPEKLKKRRRTEWHQKQGSV